MANQQYEVRTRFGNNWENCWHEDEKPLTFNSPQEAQTELDEFLEDIKDAVAMGHMDEEYDPDDYKIFMVDKEEGTTK